MTNVKKVVKELKDLIASNPQEREVQVFLEQYPWLLVNTHIQSNVVISQFPLGSDFRCDFAYFFSWSSGSFIQLIEIESPQLEIFNTSDEFTREFNHSLQQLEDWNGWVEQNRDSIHYTMEPLVDEGLLSDFPSFTRVRLRLIAGRRAQLSTARRRRRWEERINRLPANTEIRTYEGFLSSLPLGMFEQGGGTMWTKCVRYGQQGFRDMN